MRVFRVLWPLISLPMMLSFCYIYNSTRSFGSTMWRSAAKCGATFVAVITAVLGIVLFNLIARRTRGCSLWRFYSAASRILSSSAIFASA